MNLKNGSTALFVKDIEVAKKFYIDLLGMSVMLDFGKNVIFQNGFAIWEIEENHIIPQKLGLERVSDPLSNRFELFFETEQLIENFESLKRNNVVFLHEVTEEPWGQLTIRFFDPDKHLIEIGESIEQFVTNLYRQGLSLEQVSKKTSVPLSEVERLVKKNQTNL
jgi:catechol 2,3-dioxygenase-like lactoylglutathione lyase family enzyme